MKLNESSVSNETSIKETKRCFAVLFNLWKPNGKLQNQWLHPDQSMLHILSLFFVCMWSLLMAQELTKPWNYLELPQEVSSSVREEIWTNSVLLSFWKEFWFCSCFPHVPPPVSSCRAASVAMGLLLQPLWILEKVFLPLSCRYYPKRFSMRW